MLLLQTSVRAFSTLQTTDLLGSECCIEASMHHLLSPQDRHKEGNQHHSDQIKAERPDCIDARSRAITIFPQPDDSMKTRNRSGARRERATQQRTAEESYPSTRTVRYVVKRLEQIDVIDEELSLRDARQHVYSITTDDWEGS